jgi:hypothetical protein
MGQIQRRMIGELDAAGFSYYDVNYIFRKKELQPEEVTIILKWLPDIYTEHIGTGDILVRSLIAAKEAFDPAVVIALLDREDLNDSVKCGPAVTLAYASTWDISTWLRKRLEVYRFESALLIAGLPAKGGFGTREELLDFLKRIFDKYCCCESWFRVFRKYATKEEIPFLQNGQDLGNKLTRSESIKSINMINARKKTFKFP